MNMLRKQSDKATAQWTY